MIAALKVPSELRAVSDSVVCSAVLKKLPRPNKGPCKTPNPVAGLGPCADFGLRPIDMLLELGAATTPPLPDHLRLSARWGLLRYGWALAAPTTALSPLHLSSHAMKVKYHRKALQSEELGVGLACWVTKELLAARHPGAAILLADGEQALHANALMIPGGTALSLSTTGKMPDYFGVAYDPPTATILEVVVLECKGTHTDAHVFIQLADAMHQVEAVTVGGCTANALAIGAILNDQRIRVYAIDPEGSALSGDVAPRHTREHLRAEVLNHGQLDIVDPPRFRRRLLDVGAAQMLTWAGFTEAAAARLAEDRTSDHGPAPEEVRENEAGEFAGLSCRLPLDHDTTYEVFFGLDRRVAAALTADKDEDEQEALAAIRDQTDHARTRRSKGEPSEDLNDDDDALPEDVPADPPERVRRPGIRHVILDDAGEPNAVRTATPEGLYLEVHATSGAA